jgi:hypothetical protein
VNGKYSAPEGNGAWDNWGMSIFPVQNGEGVLGKKDDMY